MVSSRRKEKPAHLRAVPAPKGPGLAKSRPRPLVLIVDDSPDGRNTMSTYLSSYGYRTEVCSTGEEAVQLALSLKPDAVLMDIVLPGISGAEATARIRLHKRTRNIPIIGISGTMAMEAPETLGFDDFVQKPISIVVLEDIIRQHIVTPAPKAR